MSISKKDINHIAKLARLDLSDEEREKLTADLAGILDYVQELKKADTRTVNINLAETHPVNQTRRDAAEDSGTQKEILSQAPKRRDNFFEVKAVLE